MMRKNDMNQKDKIELDKMISNNYQNTTGIMVLKTSEIIYENYFNGYTASDAIHVASVTKSIVSGLFGIAIESGYIKSIDQKVLDFFPDYTVIADEKTIQNITIKNLLTMTAPYKYKVEPYEKFFASENWINAALDLLGGKKGKEEFTYSAIIGTHILSGILAKATGQSVFDFASEKLFLPLEIRVGHNVLLRNKEEQLAFFHNKSVRGWVADQQGINTAGWGLTLTLMDLAKIGQLYLDGGVWKEKQIIPTWWIDESTKEHSRCKQWGNHAYGYLWWILDEKEQSYAAMGDGGNVIYVNKKKNIVVAMTSLFMPNAKDRIKLIKEYIEPLLENCGL
jgi:CubicO group peptidase (beta-lactamase class C family)